MMDNSHWAWQWLIHGESLRYEFAMIGDNLEWLGWTLKSLLLYFFNAMSADLDKIICQLCKCKYMPLLHCVSLLELALQILVIINFSPWCVIDSIDIDQKKKKRERESFIDQSVLLYEIV